MKDIKPLRFAQSLLFFGCSAALFRVSVYHLMPLLLRLGVVPFWAFVLSYTLPLTILMLATFFCLAREGNLRCWRQRLRFTSLTYRQAAMCVGLFVLGFLLTGLLLPTANYLASLPFLKPPGFLPAILDPTRTTPGGALTTFMGVPLKGAYWLVLVYFVFLTFFNILGEEIWFRGYLLPRQEIAWGQAAWLYHGVFWSLFHVPIYPWTLFYLLPTTLTISFAAQRFRSTWAGFIIHYLGNGILALLPIARGVM